MAGLTRQERLHLVTLLTQLTTSIARAQEQENEAAAAASRKKARTKAHHETSEVIN
jgi:hypothetical protein